MQENKIVRIAVESTGVASIGHCAENSMLEVEFRTGEVYRYFAVPRTIYEGFVGAESKGAYFHRFVRQRFPYVRTSDHRSDLNP